MRYLLLFMTVCFISLVGCASEEEVNEQLIDDAEEHINLGKTEEGILLYERVLNRTNDPEVQERIQQLRNEQD